MKAVIGTAVVALLAASSALAGLGEGDTPPVVEADTTYNLSSFSAQDLEGKVVLYEIFRTW